MGNKIIAGLIAIGLVSAVGLHSAQLAQLAPAASKAGSGLLHTAETGAA